MVTQRTSIPGARVLIGPFPVSCRMTDETPLELRARAGRVLRLARTISNDGARGNLLDYAQELVERAEHLEHQDLAVTADIDSGEVRPREAC